MERRNFLSGLASLPSCSGPYWGHFALARYSTVSLAKSLRRHHKDFFPLDVSTSVLDGRLIRRPAKDACRKCEPDLPAR